MSTPAQAMEQKLSSEQILSYTSPNPRILEVPKQLEATRFWTTFEQFCMRSDSREAWGWIKNALETLNVDINAKFHGEGGKTLLMLVAQKTHERNIELLDTFLKQPGINVSATCTNGKTALFYVLEDTLNNRDETCQTNDNFYSWSVVDRLKKAGSEIDHVDSFGFTPLMYAWRQGYQRAAQRFLILGADLEKSEVLSMAHLDRMNGALYDNSMMQSVIDPRDYNIPQQILLSKYVTHLSESLAPVPAASTSIAPSLHFNYPNELSQDNCNALTDHATQGSGPKSSIPKPTP